GASVSCGLSANRHSLVGPSFPAAGVGPSLRSAYRAPPGPRRGFHVPHGRDPTGEGALSTPGPRCSHVRLAIIGRRCRFPAAGPAPSAASHLRALPSRGIDEGIACAHPSGLPLACGPRLGRAPLGLAPDASYPAVASDARHGGDGSGTL